MNRALITGGAGFIGLALARRLAHEGWGVDLLDDFSRAARDSDSAEFQTQKNVRLREMDLLDRAAVRELPDDYTCIFHFAAIVGVDNVDRNPEEVLRRNVALTTVAIDVAKRQKMLRHFIFASTSEVYAGALENFDLPIPTPEDAPLALPDVMRPRTSYMLSKVYGEALCLHSGLPVKIIRPHNIYGPRMGLMHVIPELLQRGHRIPEGGELAVYSVDHTRTFCFIDDAVEMIWRLAESDEPAGLVVNIGTQEPEITIGALAEIVIAALGKSLTIDPLPAARGSPTRRAPDMSRCTKITGYRSQVPVEEGIARTYEWYRANVF